MKFLLGVETITTINDGGLAIRYTHDRGPVQWQPDSRTYPVLSIEVMTLSLFINQRLNVNTRLKKRSEASV